MIHLRHILEATHGVLLYAGKQNHFDAFCHDTRQLIPGEMFVAVRGEQGDGHDYLLDAIQRGAAGLLLETRIMGSFPEEIRTAMERAGVATIAVADTRIALQNYASFILQLWQPTVIAVTGSTGKTSTKEAIATVLASNFATFKSWQNYNDLLGVPLSLGRLEERHEFAVLELSCDHPGEISDLCRITQPDIGVLTNISPTQLQFFGTVEHLAAELGTLLTALPEDGLAVVNGDDELIRSLTPGCIAPVTTFTPSKVRDVQVGWSLSCVLAEENEQANKERLVHLTARLIGRHFATTLLAAYCVGRHCGLKVEEIQQVLAPLHSLPGRLYTIQGLHSTKLLDDTHNANPASMIAGLEALKELPTVCRIAILGDMLRLGNNEEEAHRAVGIKAASCVDYLITRGERAAFIAEAAQGAGLAAERVIITSTHEDAAKAALSIMGLAAAGEDEPRPYGSTKVAAAGEDEPRPYGSGSTKAIVLIKGSEETRMEWVTEMLMAEAARAPELLVRQTPGWKQIVVMRADRPTWVEIDLSAIANNTRQIKALLGQRVRILASLKADAYGHGAVKVARTVLHNGASMLGVATVSEARPLRDAGIDAPILVFGYVPPWQMREAVRLDLTVTLYAVEAAQALSRATLALKQSVKVHVKVDTGMGRLGIRAEQVDQILALVREILALPGLELEGIFTHFAMADTQDLEHAHLQLARFREVVGALEEQRLRPPLVHAANSAALLSLPEAHFDMVRPGIALYGLDPSAEMPIPMSFRPALSFKTQVSQVKVIPAGECISYGCTYVTEKPTRVAVLPVGYADGFRRAPANWGNVLLHEQEAPILGRVCMDQCIIDVTHIPQARVGDEVVLIGKQGQATLTAEMVAQRLGTSNYEVVSAILARVPRVD